MNNIEGFLNRAANKCEYGYYDDIYNLYDFVSNTPLRVLFASYHSQLNKLFTTLNNDIRVSYDEAGNKIYNGGYYHAEDSRNLITLLDNIDILKSKLVSSGLAFEICNNVYADTIRKCRTFLKSSYGSEIPMSFTPFDISEFEPIFQLSNNIAISHDSAIIHSSLKLKGEGSYARVYNYIDPFYDMPFIVKRAKPGLDQKALSRFRQEYDTMKKLHSPYLVEVYSFNDTKHEYTMEYMDETIRDYINRKNNTLTLIERKKIIYQICKGLNYLHSKNVLHRDLSLTNVFVKHYDDVDVIKLGDFGLVKLPDSTLTSTQSEFKGSLNDPDLINVGFSNYEMCHEIYALTRLCFFILTGKQNIEKQHDGVIKQFWITGTNPDRKKRYKTVDELQNAVSSIKADDMK